MATPPTRTEFCHLCVEAGRLSELVYTPSTVFCPTCCADWTARVELRACSECGINASHWRWKSASWCTGCLVEKRPVREPKR